MEHVAPDRMCDSSLKWSGRLSHWARRSWSVTLPPLLKHLWGVLLIFNPLKNTCSFIIDFFGFSLSVWFELKPWDWETDSECTAKDFSAGKSAKPKVLYSVHLLNHPAKKKKEQCFILSCWSYSTVLSLKLFYGKVESLFLAGFNFVPQECTVPHHLQSREQRSAYCT